MTRYVLTAATVAASALLALTILSPMPAQEANLSPAAPARIETGHMLVQQSVEATLEARRAAARAADAELAASRHAASEAADRVATAPKRSKPTHIAAVHPAADPLPLPTASPVRPAVPPVAEATPRPSVAARVVGTAGRVPRWLGSKIVNAATWVVELPGQVVGRLPERRFL